MSVYPIVAALVAKLFEAEGRRLNGRIVDLNQKNKRLKDVRVDGFLHGGVFYLPRDVSTTVLGPGQAKVTLHRDLEGEFLDFLADQQQVYDERRLVQQTLFSLLNPCRTDQEMRDALPECLVGLVPHLAPLPRSNEPAHTLQDNPRALRQYEKTLPKMELYSAVRLLY